MTLVFISHSSTDAAFVRDTLKPLLAQRSIEFFYSGEHIEGGADFNQRIHAALEACTWFLVVLSPAACVSDWVGAEVEWAFNHRPERVLPLLIAPCVSARLHVRLLRLQAYDYHANPGLASRRLLDRLSPPPDGPAASPEIDRPFGKYRILSRLGSGAFGTVYEAWDESLRRRVALKVAKGDALGPADPRDIQRFHEEPRLAAELDHPNIVRIYESGVVERSSYYAMEYVEGVTLGHWIERRRTLAGAGATEAQLGATEIQMVLRWAEQAAQALHRAHCHQRPGKGPTPIIHRDVKPENLMIDADDQVKVLDFGLARDERGSLVLTQKADMLGTPMYMSPEQALNPALVDARADVYSLGMTLYSALTLHEPFEASSPESLLRKVIAQDPVPARKRNPRISREAEAIVQRATARSPDQRYGSSAAMAADLRACLENRPTLARPVGPLGRVWKSFRRHPRRVALAVGLPAIAVLTVVAMSWLRSDHAGREAHEQYQLAQARALELASALERAQPPLWERRALALQAGDLREWFAQGPVHDAKELEQWRSARELRSAHFTSARSLWNEADRAFQRAEALFVEARDSDGARNAAGQRHATLARWLLGNAGQAERRVAQTELAKAQELLGEDAPGLAELAAQARGLARLRVELPNAWQDVDGPSGLAQILARYAAGETVFVEVQDGARRAVQPLRRSEALAEPLARSVRRVCGARVAIHAVDAETLQTSETPLPGYEALPLPLDVTGLPPGEYMVVLRDPGLAPWTQICPLSFPVLLAPGDDWRTELPIALAEIPEGMVYVPAGPALLGATGDNPDQRPLRFVQDVPAFFLDRREFSAAQVREWIGTHAQGWRSKAEEAGGSWVWQARANPEWGAGACWQAPFSGTSLATLAWDPLHPATHLRIEEARRILGSSLRRLPTEIEWEKAARGLDGRRYPWGQLEPQELLWRAANLDTQSSEELDGWWGTAPVGSFALGSSPYGAQDMAGNVLELTGSPYFPDLYARADMAAALASGASERWSVRGGAYSGISKMIDGAHRGSWPYVSREGSQEACSALGFRGARDTATSR